MTLKDIPDTLTEPRMTLARQVEFVVTNGLGYNTTTDFQPHFYRYGQIKHSEKGLQAHLAHLEMNKHIPSVRGIYWELENAPEDHEFSVYEKKFFGLIRGKLVNKKLNSEERDSGKKELERFSKFLEESFQFKKYDAEYPSSMDKLSKYLQDKFECVIVNMPLNFFVKPYQFEEVERN